VPGAHLAQALHRAEPHPAPPDLRSRLAPTPIGCGPTRTSARCAR
jgi:hypothetical protein